MPLATSWIDLARHPVDALDAPPGRALVEHRRERLRETGACELPGFLHPPAVARNAWEPLREFVRRAMDLPVIHRYADPLGACSVNVFEPGDEQNWHFEAVAVLGPSSASATPWPSSACRELGERDTPPLTSATPSGPVTTRSAAPERKPGCRRGSAWS